MRPNIVWIFGDEWRHDALGYAGNTVVRTPHLDALAARGHVFTKAYCESPVCQSSRASLLTVSFPRDHGKYQNGARFGDFPGPGVPNFLHRLQGAGYRTAEIGKMHFFSRPHTDDELRAYGFHDVAEEHDKGSYRFDQIETPYKQHLRERGLLDAFHAHQRAQGPLIMGTDPDRVVLNERAEIADTLDAFIASQAEHYIGEHANDSDPFFLWIGFIGPHPPLDPPSPYAEMFDPADIPLGPKGFDPQPDNRWGEYVRWVRDMFHCERYSEDDWRTMAAAYYGNIALLDDQVGRIVRAIDDAGVAGHTWIVFSADHGELMGDHGMIEKAVFYETSVRVPALVVPPPGHEPRVVDGLVQEIDVVSTILDVAGADDQGFCGRSLLRPDPARAMVFSQIGDFTMVFDGRHKLVVDRRSLEPMALYDLGDDPDERKEVLGDRARTPAVDTMLADLVRPFADGALPERAP